MNISLHSTVISSEFPINYSSPVLSSQSSQRSIKKRKEVRALKIKPTGRETIIHAQKNIVTLTAAMEQSPQRPAPS
jgi:hypothetical protein